MAEKITTDFKALLTIKHKSRLDTIADQYNRIFMVRILLVCTTVMAISWYTDPMQCIVPKAAQVDGAFVSAACWIQGVYVYKQLLGRIDNNMGYFGIPKNMDHEGILVAKNGREDLCFLKPKLGVLPNPDCVEMTKTFFLQYQYMPFFFAALSVLYFLPYILFCFVNKDKKQLKDAINMRRKADQGESVISKGAHEIVNFYFPSFKLEKKKRWSGDKETIKMSLRICLNVIIKILYFLSNVLTLLAIDHILNGEYIAFGSNFVKWAGLTNTKQYDYMGMRDHPKPGNLLLPPFGYCELYESSRDVKTTIANKYKFVCEVSQNILYQYCLALFWFAIFGGYIASIVGLIHLFLTYIQLTIGRLGDSHEFKFLHLRELELLAFMRVKDIGLYGECKDILRTRKESKLNSEPYNL